VAHSTPIGTIKNILVEKLWKNIIFNVINTLFSMVFNKIFINYKTHNFNLEYEVIGACTLIIK